MAFVYGGNDLAMHIYRVLQIHNEFYTFIHATEILLLIMKKIAIYWAMRSNFWAFYQLEAISMVFRTYKLYLK